jgi:hypothetical protein
LNTVIARPSSFPVASIGGLCKNSPCLLFMGDDFSQKVLLNTIIAGPSGIKANVCESYIVNLEKTAWYFYTIHRDYRILASRVF